MSNHIDASQLSDEQIERVVNSKGFQKMLAYNKLADGIGVLRDQDEIFDSMVESIRKQHSNVQSEDSVREFFELFVAEVESFTEPLTGEGDEDVDAADLEDIFVDEGGDE